MYRNIDVQRIRPVILLRCFEWNFSLQLPIGIISGERLLLRINEAHRLVDRLSEV